jgi:hypothetical protein
VKPAAMRESRDIEWLVNWALEKQGLGKGGFEREAQGRAGDIPTGMRVDGGGYSNEGKWVHEDARLISSWIDRMASDPRTSLAAGLVARHGLTGTRPSWGDGQCGRYVLLRKGNGKAVRRYSDQTRQRGLLGFEWEWEGYTVEDLERMMLEYVAWWAALDDLREHVNTSMTKYVAVGPLAPEFPWDEVGRTVHYPSGASPVGA